LLISPRGMILILLVASIFISAVYLLIAALYIALFYTERPVYHKLARYLTLAIISVHLVSVVYAGIVEGRIPLTSTYRVISFLTMIIAGIYIFVEHRLRARSLGAFVFPLIFIFHVISYFGFGVISQELDIFKTPIFWLHIISSLCGYSAFVYSMVLGVMYLYLFYSLKKRNLRVMYDRLPPLEPLEKMIGTSQIGGLCFLTLGIIGGALMAQREWNQIPVGDPKILLTGLIFVIYLVNVILKFLFRWSGKRMAYMAVLGFCILMFVFVGVNFIFPTMHDF
jgi:ABC-type uncharacterized transport system permease subunit